MLKCRIWCICCLLWISWWRCMLCLVRMLRVWNCWWGMLIDICWMICLILFISILLDCVVRMWFICLCVCKWKSCWICLGCCICLMCRLWWLMNCVVRNLKWCVCWLSSVWKICYGICVRIVVFGYGFFIGSVLDVVVGKFMCCVVLNLWCWVDFGMWS